LTLSNSCTGKIGAVCDARRRAAHSVAVD
jgi:hypothetical protein